MGAARKGTRLFFCCRRRVKGSERERGEQGLFFLPSLSYLPLPLSRTKASSFTATRFSLNPADWIGGQNRPLRADLVAGAIPLECSSVSPANRTDEYFPFYRIWTVHGCDKWPQRTHGALDWNTRRKGPRSHISALIITGLTHLTESRNIDQG